MVTSGIQPAVYVDLRYDMVAQRNIASLYDTFVDYQPGDGALGIFNSNCPVGPRY
jgi:hypothetical protein